jgi:hypothetical protein
MFSRRIVLSVVAVVALVLSSAGSAEARLFGGCGCHGGGCCGGFLRNLFHGHGCCASDCGCESSCGCESGCDGGCEGGCDGGCGCGEATEGSAPAAPEAAPAAPEKSA